MSDKYPLEFIKTMTRYGIMLGGILGFVGAVPIALLWFDITLLLPVLALAVIITMCGGLIGMLYGALAGFISGILMTTTTRLFFRQLTPINLYKVVMGMLACMTIIAIFIVDYRFIGGYQADFFTRTIALHDWVALWGMALIFAIYASQRTIQHYTR